MRSIKLFICLVGVGLITLGIGSAVAQCEGNGTLIAIGGGYADTYDGFIAAALKHIQADTLKIVVLPSAYASNADEITDEERQDNLDTAENRRQQIEEACTASVPDGVMCQVTLPPIFTRSDALDPANLEYFTDDLAAIYILGGDQTVAMDVLAGTPIEEALSKAYSCGTVIAGTSAGEAVQSKVMIGGYVSDYGPESGLKENIVDVWNTADRRGLSFGITDAVLEQHFWERGRFGRLLNVLVQPDVPPIGIAVDGYTAIEITDGKTLGNVFGLYSVAVLDAHTFDAAHSAIFRDGILSIHNVLFHLLAPGDFSYDLTTRASSIAPLPHTTTRVFDTLTAPEWRGHIDTVEWHFSGQREFR